MQLVVARHYLFCCQRTNPSIVVSRSREQRTTESKASSAGAKHCFLSFAGRCLSGRRLVGLGRLELPTSPLSGVRSNHLSYRPLIAGTAEAWWSWSGSNRRPPECKSGALPAELQPRLAWAKDKKVLEADWTPGGFDQQSMPRNNGQHFSVSGDAGTRATSGNQKRFCLEGNGCHLLLRRCRRFR